MERISLEYLHVDEIVERTALGFPVINIYPKYRGRSIRNRVIVRFDIVSAMTAYFEQDTLDNYRDIVYGLISGILDEEDVIAGVFEELYLKDFKFRKLLGESYYFDNSLEEASLYEVIILKLITAYNDLNERLANVSRELRYKYIAESEGWAYISVPDQSEVIYVPGDYKEEVVSIAKVWNGQIKRFRYNI